MTGTREGCAQISDGELLRRFEDCSLPPEQFQHADHVRLAWIYARRQTAAATIASFDGALRRFTRHHGASDKYHATITWFYLLAIQERVARAPHLQTWREFAGANPDLLDWKSPLIARYYSKELLQSPLARQVFLLPPRDHLDPTAETRVSPATTPG